MTHPSDPSLQTRLSLLSRLRDLDDHESWRSFFDRYWRLLYNVARRSGLDESAAQDVVQETVISVAKKMPGFHYDPERGTFKQWLMRIARRRITDHFRKVYRVLPMESLDSEKNREIPISDDHSAGPMGDFLEKTWDEEWEKTLLDAAISRIRGEVNPKHFQVFDYCVLQGWSNSKTAATLNISSAQVYLAKHRVAKAVKRAVLAIRKEM